MMMFLLICVVLAFSALSALDIALWDLKGKILGLPVFRLLGGNKTQIPCYASGGWTSYTTEELVDETLRMKAVGYKFIKIKVGVEGGNNINEDARRIQAVRNAIGSDIGIMIDANNAFTSAIALKLAQKIEDSDILFFEEPVFADDLPGLERFRSQSKIPCASGEHEYTRFGARELISRGCIDYLQSDVTRCGGITEVRKMIAFAQAYNILYAPHGFDLLHAHLLSAYANGVFLESLFMFNALIKATFLNAPEPVNGMMTLPEKPGLGLELNYMNLKLFRSLKQEAV
jgi:L-rhamnonate dehydratase